MNDQPVGVSPVPHGRIVVIADDPEEVVRLTDALEPSGQRVVTVEPGRDALRQIVDDDAAVVVLDVRPPEIDALEMVRAIRAEDPAVARPVLLLIDDHGDPSVTSTYRLGAVDTVSAPVDAEEVRAKVGLLADLTHTAQELAARSEQVRRADERAHQNERALEAQQAVMHALVSSGSDDILPRVAQSLASGLGWQVGVYWTSAGSELRCAESWFSPALEASALEQIHADSSLGPPAGVVGRAVDSGRPVWALLSDFDPADGYVQAARQAGLSGAFALPITDDSELLGVIELLRTSSEPPADQVLATLDAIAALVGRFAHARRTEERTESLQNEFFALVSHELLTPLTSILGYLEELLAGASGEFNEDQKQDLNVISRNAHRLFRLVDDLMFVAKVETGKLSLNLTSVDLAAVTLEAVEAAEPSAKGRDVQILTRLDPVPPVRGDVMRLGQVVDHLISNAVKFSHDGGRVQVVLRQRGDQAVIEVIDQGLGIPLAEQSRVFERFSRSSIASAMEIPGIGIGLSICKVIVDAHAGAITMDSVEGVGSTFTVSLPFEAGRTDGEDDDDRE